MSSKKAFLKVEEVKRKAAGRWDFILRNLAPFLADALDHPGRHMACPRHGGTDGFRVFKDVNETGGSYCNTCGGHPDGISTLEWANGTTFRETLEMVDELINGHIRSGAPVVVPPPAPAKKREDAAVLDQAARMRMRAAWYSSLPLSAPASEPARLYLKHRGLNSLPDCLRYHEEIAYHQEGKLIGMFPAILAMVKTCDGVSITLHRTFITKEGRKAQLPEAKKLMSVPSDMTVKGGAIQLFPVEDPFTQDMVDTMAVGEGIETSIAVTEATGIPCWATVSATFMGFFEPPKGIKRVIVFCDKDRPSEQHPEGHGQEAAKALVKKLWEKGIAASIAIPPTPIADGVKNVDWLDEYVQNGREAFKDSLAA